MSLQVKFYADKFGLDQRGMFQNLGLSLADDVRNIVYVKNQGFKTRNGYQTKGKEQGGFGLAVYRYIDSTGSTNDEILIIDEKLWRVNEGTLNITYTGSSPTGVVRLKVNEENNINMLLYVDNTEEGNFDLGRGYEETAIVTISDLATLIGGVSDFTATVTGDGSVSAAFLDITDVLYLPANEQRTISFRYYTMVNDTVGDSPVFEGLSSKIGTDDLQNVSWALHNNLIFFADGGPLKVYDGQTVYTAGLPQPDAPLNGNVTPGAITGDTIYFISYVHVDNQGKRTESALSDPLEVTLFSEQIRLDFLNIQESSGYNTGCAVITGNQTVAPSSGLVTLNTQVGLNTLRAGDTAYLLNRTTGVYTTYSVDSVTSNTVVLESEESIQVNDEDVISNNLRIRVYKIPDNDTEAYLIAEIPNNSFTSTSSYTDNETDMSDNVIFLGTSSLVIPPPEISDKVISYKGNLIVANGTDIYWSEERDFTVNTAGQAFEPEFVRWSDTVTGLELSGNSMVVFQKNRIDSLVAQDMNDETSFTLASLTTKFGASGQASIVTLGSKLYFLSETGVYTIQAGTLTIDTTGLPVLLSDPIYKIFLDGRYKLKRSVGGVLPKESLILFSLPVEFESTPHYGQALSITIVYDVVQEKWSIWDNFDITGGAILDDNLDFWFVDRRSVSSLRRHLNKRLTFDLPDVYFDHADNIRSYYLTKWDSLDDSTTSPSSSTSHLSIRTKELRKLELFSLDTSEARISTNPTYGITIYKDYVPTLIHSNFSSQFETSGNPWDTFPWDAAPYGGWQNSSLILTPTADLVRALQVRFESNESMNISGYNVTYVPQALTG